MFARAVSDDEIDSAILTYREQGYAILPGVASEGTLTALRERATAIARGELRYPGLFFQPDAPSGRYEDLAFGQGWLGPDTNYRKIEKLELDPLFRAWIENAVFARIVRRVIHGPVSIYRAAMFWKAARVGSELPWHQDGGRFWGLNRDPELQLWTAFDDASRQAGCLEVLPGSHKAGIATPLGGVVPQPKVDAANADAKAVALPARAGDVVILHNHLWHRSGPNWSDSPRRGLTICYMDGAIRCTRTKRAPRRFVRVFEGDPV